MQPTHFGTLADGRAVEAWTLENGAGLRATLLTYGARLAALHVPVGGGHTRNVALGLATLDEYVANTAYLGAVPGRYANRIARGRFPLDGREVQVTTNNGPNMLHGGKTGFDRAVWRAQADGDAVVMAHTSPDGDQGFPGRLDVTVRYALDGGDLVIDTIARADAPTVLNLTSHAYFNLSGGPDILDHTLTLAANHFTPVDAGLIPTGELAPVAGTPFDFRTPVKIGARIDADHPQLRFGVGYDHNFVLGAAPADAPRLAAAVSGDGLMMQALTTEPGVQFYTGNHLPDAGLPYRSAFCLETQHFPDSPNHPAFPTTVLRPGEVFRARTIYRFTSK